MEKFIDFFRLGVSDFGVISILLFIVKLERGIFNILGVIYFGVYVFCC